MDEARELELIRAVRGPDLAASLDARDALIAAHDGLVRRAARKYEGHGVERDDLLQQGRIGLMQAIDGFDPDLGYRLSTYAAPRIRQWMMAAIGGPIRMGRDAAARVTLADRIASALSARLGRPAADEEVAAVARWSPARMSEVRRLRRLRDRDESDGVGERAFVAPDAEAPDPLEEAERDREAARIRDAVRALSPRRYQAIYLRFGLDSRGRRGRSIGQVAGILGMSKQCVSVLVREALEDLRRAPIGADPAGTTTRPG